MGLGEEVPRPVGLRNWQHIKRLLTRMSTIGGGGSNPSPTSISHGGVYSAEEEEEEESIWVQDVTGQGEPWEWVGCFDELLSEMRKGEVFAGFKEGLLAFPPSFRWKPRATAGDYDQVIGWMP